MLHSADGVNGLLRSSRLSFVTWAFNSFAESRKTWRGFGGFAGILVDEELSLDKEVINWESRAREDVVRSTRFCMSVFDDALFVEVMSLSHCQRRYRQWQI